MFNPTQFSYNLSNILEKTAGTYALPKSFKHEFKEEVKDSLKKVLAGFWIYNTSDSSRPYTIDDRIELKSNGIIWQVTRVSLRLPAGGRQEVTHVHNAYLYPHSPAQEDSSKLLCDMETIRHVFLVGHDTCYGQSFTLDVWEVSGNGKFFTLARRLYTAYTDPDLTKFFPQGLIKLTDKIAVRQCSVDMSITRIIRGVIGEDLRHNKIDERTWEDVTSLVKEYYFPFCLDGSDYLNSWTPVRGAFPVIISMTILSNGDVSDATAQVKGQIEAKKYLENRIAQEIKLWKFDALKKESGVFTCSFSDTLNY
jgi:hypothetical protein